MLNENEIIDAVCPYLEANGYRIIQRLSTTEKGVDIVGQRIGTSEIINVEAKGGTSSRAGSSRFGKPYTKSQVFDLVSKGFFATCRLVSKRKNESESVMLAVPDESWFRTYIESISPALSTLQIKVLLVSDSRSVRQF